MTIPTGGHFAQEGHAVQVFAIKTTTDVVKSLQSNVPRVGEPAAGLHRSSGQSAHAGERLQAHGNCAGRSLRQHRLLRQLGAAGAPIVLSQNWDELRNTVILLAVVGSGLAWGGMRITRE